MIEASQLTTTNFQLLFTLDNYWSDPAILAVDLRVLEPLDCLLDDNLGLLTSYKWYVEPITGHTAEVSIFDAGAVNFSVVHLLG